MNVKELNSEFFLKLLNSTYRTPFMKVLEEANPGDFQTNLSFDLKISLKKHLAENKNADDAMFKFKIDFIRICHKYIMMYLNKNKLNISLEVMQILKEASSSL